ncbi:MAG: nucleotidyltransferase domain-containing protein [Candidatus Bathyarchaeota archaeon]|nr:nucleotidyltransferase domain-containing protein [Candidatus Bathyarchaeota archaeon]
MKAWTPRDGDTFVTKDDFVFYVFGYEHPKNRVLAFLKYIPSKLKPNFPIRFLRQRWKLGNVELARPEKLYTAQNYQAFLETFRKTFPQYIYSCPYRQKELISIPLEQIKNVYVPRESLHRLFEKRKKDHLQKLAIELISLFSIESQVPLRDFGIHGSIALNMHTAHSDIDLVVYGSRSFRNLEKAINRLVKDAKIKHVFTKKLDKARKHRGRYKDRLFVYNSVRKLREIDTEYGSHRYLPIRHVTFSCEVVDDKEAMFRPAIYQIKNCQLLDSLDAISKLSEDEIPKSVVSMVGYYRNVARYGDKIKVSGTLERVENIERGETIYQVVVGTGTRQDEYIWPA